MEWIGSGWVFNNNLLYRDNSIIGEENIKLKGGIYEFSTDKTYLYKVDVSDINDNGWESIQLLFSTPFGGGYSLDDFQNLNNYSLSNGLFNIYSSPEFNITTDEKIDISANENFTNPKGIISIDIISIDWRINGYSWINNSQEPWNLTQNERINNYCPGWSYNFEENSFLWYYTNSNQSNYIPKSLIGEDIVNPKFNFISKFINFNNFNLSFIFDKKNIVLDGVDDYNENLAGIKIYLSDIEPPSNINLNSTFLEFIEQAREIVNLNINPSEQDPTVSDEIRLEGLPGFKYVVIIADVIPSQQQEKSVLIELSSLKIEGGYHPGNNEIYNMDFDNDLISDIEGATFSTLYGDIEINSKIGNGYFMSGIWENGVWNNGWRKDEMVKYFFDIDLSVKIESNIKWKFRLVGREGSASNFKVGDNVSIGNIIGIDINEKRKLLKGRYKIVSKLESQETSKGILDFLIVELETTFPLRRIEKDSDNHRIYVTKNIWLSGAFLNGYFTGVWNYGLFQGYPLITEMYDTQFIDGVFQGGHFNSENYNFIKFKNIKNSSNQKLSLVFDEYHNLFEGDIITIYKDDEINDFYNGDTIVKRIINDIEIETDKDWIGGVEGEYTGSVYVKYNTGLIQNVKLNTLNVSKKTTLDTFESSGVFIYNSWIDVNFNNESSVNIGKLQTKINNISKKDYSENNLYGYPSYDILSSISTFRDSYSLSDRTYKLGSKYEIYNDYIGESSIFSEYFDGDDISLFLEQGWTFSISDNNYGTFSRTESLLDDEDIEGSELNIQTIGEGVVLNIGDTEKIIRSRNTDSIPKLRYSLIEFDLIKPKSVNEENAIYNQPDSLYPGVEYPTIHFDNINIVNKKIQNLFGEEQVINIPSTFFPIYKNVNHLLTSKRKKVEYFFNKKNLSMNIKGNGLEGENDTNIIINNLKFLELDMIPFFKYFNYKNINLSIQKPYEGVAPIIDYDDENFKFLDNIKIELNSIILNKNILSGEENIDSFILNTQNIDGFFETR